jgi:hypothetical protein
VLTAYKQIADYQRACQLKSRHITEILPLEVVKKLVKTCSQLPAQDELNNNKKLVYASLKKKYIQTQQASRLKKLLYKGFSSQAEVVVRPTVHEKQSVYFHFLTNKKLVQYRRLRKYLDSTVVGLRYRTAGFARLLTYTLLKHTRRRTPATALSLKYGQGNVRF